MFSIFNKKKAKEGEHIRRLKCVYKGGSFHDLIEVRELANANKKKECLEKLDCVIEDLKLSKQELIDYWESADV